LSDAFDLADVGDNADLRVNKDIQDHPKPGGVVGGLDVPVQVASPAFVMQSSVTAYSFQQALGQN